MKLIESFNKTVLTVAFPVVMAALMQVQTAQAQADVTNSLYNLANTPGATLSIGDKIFSGFSYLDSGLTSFDASNILVTASEVGGVYLLTWGGDISLASGGAASADLLLNYTVTATDGEIFAIDQNYTGSADPAGGAFLSVVENAYIPGNVDAVANSSLNENIDSTSFTNIGAVLSPAQPILNVTKDIGLGVSDGGFITISQVEQSFEQVAVVPEPASVGLLLLGLGGLTFTRRFKRQTNERTRLNSHPSMRSINW
jgi:hypothetical protein